MPKLYGAPAYARPQRSPVTPVDRPFDPDDLPLESERRPRKSGSSCEELTASIVRRRGDRSEPPAGGGRRHRSARRPFRLRLPGRSQRR